MFEAPRHHSVVSTEDAQSVAVGMLQQQPQAEAMVPLVLGGYRQLAGIGRKRKGAQQTPCVVMFKRGSAGV